MSRPWVAAVDVAAEIARARPKSATFTRPSSVSRTFSGFTSRCTKPARCAASSACSTGSRIVSACSGESRPYSAQDVAHGAAGDVLHDEVDDVAVLALVVDGDDVRVGQPRGRLRLAHEAGHERGVLGEARVHDLERDRAVEAEVRGLVHGGHAAAREPGLDAVARVDDPAHEGVGHSRSGRGLHGQGVYVRHAGAPGLPRRYRTRAPGGCDGDLGHPCVRGAATGAPPAQRAG